MKFTKRVSLLDETPPADRECPTGGTALTVTLNPKMYVYKPSVQYKRTSEFILKLAKRYKLTFLYLVPELTEQGNIHYHGVFKIADDNFRKLFLRTISKKIGFILTKFIDNEPKWNQYMHKDRLYLSCPEMEILQFGTGVHVPQYQEEMRRAAQILDFFKLDKSEYHDDDVSSD